MAEGVSPYHNKKRGTNVLGPAATRHHKMMLRKWFGANRGTHWSIAGSVAVIIFSGYLIYSNHSSNPTSATATAAAERTAAPMTPGPLKFNE
jgi:hypothetical protein